MSQVERQELDQFRGFYRRYYDDDIATLAQRYPNERRSLYVDYDDLYRFDVDLAERYLTHPEEMQEVAEEALRTYDLPADVSLGQAHVRLQNLPASNAIDIRSIRVVDDHIGSMVTVQGIVRKATDVRPKIVEAAFECQRCGTMTYIPQSDSGFQEPHECQGCERQGPFRINHDQSEFVDAQTLRVQESPEGLRGGETPQAIDVYLEDDVCGHVTPGDHVAVVGVLHIEQQSSGNEKSAIFDLYMDGVTVGIEDEQFEDMEIADEDVTEILKLSDRPDIYEQMVDSVAPSIYGYEQEKLAMILQLFAGVTKNLPDGSRIRGDFHMLLIGDPGTGKCVRGETPVALADGTRRPIRELVEANLTDPTPVDDGVYDEVSIPVPSLSADGRLVERPATRVWKREAPEQLVRIETASGRTLEVTPSHPLFVPTDGRPVARRADELSEGTAVVATTRDRGVATDGGVAARQHDQTFGGDGLRREQIVSIARIDHDDRWVYDLEVAGTHSYVSDGIVSHNSQLLSYIADIAPRSVYTSGKGSSSAGLTAAAVQDDFGDGQQWTLEAGALVLADQGIAAIDELDKMDASDRSAMHEALEQQSISISKAGINATLKSRCSLLGAANPKYGRFDQYEPIGEQIDLEPALVSRFDLIFTVTDQPDPDRDANLADHILKTNYAGELNTQHTELTNTTISQDEIDAAEEDVEPAIEPTLLRKYIAYAKRNCYPRMTDDARAEIREFYVDLRSDGVDEDAPVPLTARKLEALVRLAEASARVRLSDTVEVRDAQQSIEIVRSSMDDIGIDPETGELDADVVETGTSKSQRDRIKNLKGLIEELATEYDDEPGAPVEQVVERADEAGTSPDKAEQEIENLKRKGEVYEPQNGYLRTT